MVETIFRGGEEKCILQEGIWMNNVRGKRGNV